MRFATRNEIEYLSSMDSAGSRDAKLIREMSRQLNALRQYDQCFRPADCQPQRLPGGDLDSSRAFFEH